MNIVTFMRDVNGFEVSNIALDVSEQKFIDKIKETEASIIGLRGFLTLAFEPMKETINATKAAGLRDKVTFMIGGGQIDEEIRKDTDTDAYGNDAMAGVSLAKK